MAYYKCGKIFATQNSNTSIETASGAIANFNTSLAMPVFGCNAEFSASQASGTPTPAAPIPIVGVDKVNFSRCGKNLWSNEKAVTDSNTPTVYIDNEWLNFTTGRYKLVYNFQSTESVTFSAIVKNKVATSNIVTIQAVYSDGTSSNIMSISLNNTNEHTISGKTASGKTLVRLGTAWTNEVEACMKDIQLEFGSTATTYEPYNGTTALINLGGTYYGGSVDAVTGKITLTHQFYNTLGANISNVFEDSRSWRVYYSSPIYGTNFQYKEGLCDKLTFKTSYSRVNDNNNSIAFPSSAGTHILLRNDALTSRQEVRDFMTTLNVVYPLATPIVVYASNTAEIPTIVGDNQVFADTGDVEVKYRRINNDL